MVKYIKRKSDNKFLKSVETDTWVDNFKDAFEMTIIECENVKNELFNTYGLEEITEIVNVLKNKPISKEEKKELRRFLISKM